MKCAIADHPVHRLHLPDRAAGHPKHLPQFDYRGFHRYSIRFCTMERQPLFISQPVVDLVMRQLLRAAGEESIALVTYCFMPDHLHLLVAGTSEIADAKRFIARAKQYSGFYYKKAHHRRLWQRYGFERVLRNNEATLAVARHIVDNPVRAGLVADPRDYAFLGSSMYTLDQILAAIQDGITVDSDSPAEAGRHVPTTAGPAEARRHVPISAGPAEA